MKKTLIPLAVLSLLSCAAIADENADVKSFQAPLPPELTAPTTKGEPLPGPKVVTAETCKNAPEVCEARREELRRKRQACHDNPANCDDPALRASKQ